MSILKVPNMRFPQFTDEWEMRKLGEILKVGSGRDYKHLKEGNIPVFGTGGYMTSVNEFLFDGESVCIGRKGTINKPFYYNGKFWTVDTLFYTYSYKKVLPRFVFNVFEQINWLRYNEASGVPSLSKSTIEQIEISIPDISEQEKIASFLTLIDERILAQIKIIEGLKELKASLSKQIFSRKLRFKDKNGDDFPEWIEKQLGEIGEIITGKTPSTGNLNLWNGDIQFVTPTDIDGNKYQYKTERKVYNTGKLKILPAKSILFTCIASIGKMSLSIKPCITNQQINSIVPFPEFDNDYIYYALLNIVEFIKSTQSSNTLPIINKTSFSKFDLKIPKNVYEQIRISSVLSAIDEKIEIEKRILEEYTAQKQYLLKQMFI